jgi:hypothetical protein
VRARGGCRPRLSLPARPAAASAIAVSLLSAGALAGCAGSQSTGAEVQARRTDLAQVSHSLIAIEEPIAREVAAARAAWPLIDRGLPNAKPKPAHTNDGRAAATERRRSAARANRSMLRLRRLVSRAAARGGELPPALVAQAEELTGAGSEIAGLYELSSGLVAHGWAQIAATLDAAGGRDSPAARAFLRANVDTYIISVYDGNFDLSLIGKMARQAFKRLGGTAAFGRALTLAQVSALTRAYSKRADELTPHPWQHLVAQ